MADGIDEGWAIPSERAGSLMRSVPEASPEASVFAAQVVGPRDLDGGWNLAEGTSEHASPNYPVGDDLRSLDFSPAPLDTDRALSPELQDEFSKPDLALGTDVDLPTPSGLWFAELRALVPKRTPKATRRALAAAPAIAKEVNIESLFRPRQPIVCPPEPAPATEASARKPRWWRRQRTF